MPFNKYIYIYKYQFLKTFPLQILINNQSKFKFEIEIL